MFPSDVIAERVRDLRKRRSLTVKQLAELCADAGAPELTAASLNNIETGRRKEGRRTRMVTVEELLVLAYVLAAPMSSLFLPPKADALEVTPSLRMHPADVVAWFADERPPSPERHDDWVSEMGPTSIYRDLRIALHHLTAATDPDQIDARAKAFAGVADRAAEMGLRPFRLESKWVELLRPYLKYPQAVQLIGQESDDG